MPPDQTTPTQSWWSTLGDFFTVKLFIINTKSVLALIASHLVMKRWELLNILIRTFRGCKIPSKILFHPSINPFSAACQGPSHISSRLSKRATTSGFSWGTPQHFQAPWNIHYNSSGMFWIYPGGLHPLEHARKTSNRSVSGGHPDQMPKPP